MMNLRNMDIYCDFSLEDSVKMLDDNIHVPFGIVAVYLTSVWYLNQQLKKHKQTYRPPASLKKLRCCWNTFLFVFSLLGTAHVLPSLLVRLFAPSSSPLDSTCIDDASSSPLSDSICAATSEWCTGATGFWTLLFVLSKVVELGDTYFLMAGGYSVPKLHVIHHATVLPWSWYESSQATSMCHWFAAMNYTVHTVMYGYFALNDLFDDVHFRRQWGMRITMMQCTQFVLGITVISVATYHHIQQDRPCHSGTTSLLVSAGLYATYLGLFLEFADQKYGWSCRMQHAVQQFMVRCMSTTKTSTDGNFDSGEEQKTTIMPWQREGLSLAEQFQQASKLAVMLSHVAKPQEMLQLYAAFKQIHCGSTSEQARPDASCDTKTRMKWEAWYSLQGWTVEQAQKQYVATLDVLAQRANDAKQKGSHNETESSSSKISSSAIHSGNQQDPFTLYPVQIAGMGRYLPKRVVTNAEIETIMGSNNSGGNESSTADDKASNNTKSISHRSGVEERRWADVYGGENQIENAAAAVRAACENAGVALSDLDLIISCSGAGHQALPDDACLLQRELGLGESGVRAFSVHATCLGFLVGLDVAGSFMNSGRYRCVAVVSSVLTSPVTDKSRQDTHNTVALFGDGAAAAILTPSADGSSINKCLVETYAEGADLCRVDGGGTYRCPHAPIHKSEHDYFVMDGEGTMKLVSKYMSDILYRFIPGLVFGLDDLEMQPDSLGSTTKSAKFNVDWVVPHQASGLALQSLGVFGWHEDRIIKTLHKFGNCGSASIPLTLCEGILEGKIKRGDKVLLCGTSAGVSFGAMLLTY